MVYKPNSRYSQTNQQAKKSFNRKNNTIKFFILLLTGFFGVYLFVKGAEIRASKKTLSSPTVIDEDGNVQLHPDRQAKLGKELEEIDNAQQYGLYATIPGNYPCYTCPDGAKTIFLYRNEVWKYGVTRKGEQIRYPGDMLSSSRLFYVVEFEGDYAQCLKEEKRKIYNYPLLPEALKREVKLFRPPGNANDN
jgi:hypothetical protein